MSAERKVNHRLTAAKVLQQPRISELSAIFASGHALLAIEERLGEIEGHLSAAGASEDTTSARAVEAMGKIADLLADPAGASLMDVRMIIESAGWHR